MKNKKAPKVQQRLDVIKHKESGLKKIQDNLWQYFPDCMVESINWLGNDLIYNLINKRNNKKFARSVKKAIKELGFTNYVLLNDSKMFKAFYLQDYLGPVLSIYYSRDYMVAFDYFKKHGVKYEPLLIAKSDMCFANSGYLANYCRQYNANSFDVGQGCDIEDFKKVGKDDIPDDLRAIKGPIIGYMGALNSVRLDKEVIEHIARSFPECKVVLIGPEDEGFASSNLHQIENVVFMGHRPVTALPAYINGFDVCINPQILNEVTIGNYPRKIDEYLALGKPIIATRTETMEYFKDFVYLADNKEQYVDSIKLALAEKDEALAEGRKKFAFSHTWENSVKLMSEKISEALAKKA